MLLMTKEPQEEKPVFVTVEWIADYLGLNKSSVNQMIVKDGKIKYARVGGKKRGVIRVYYDDFLRYMEENTFGLGKQEKEDEE